MTVEVKGASMLTEYTLVLVATMMMVAMAAGNGTAEPVSQSIDVLQTLVHVIKHELQIGMALQRQLDT